MFMMSTSKHLMNFSVDPFHRLDYRRCPALTSCGIFTEFSPFCSLCLSGYTLSSVMSWIWRLEFTV